MNAPWLPVDPDGIPATIRQRPAVLWAAEPDPVGGKDRKVPRQIADPRRRASSTDSATWGTFDDAFEAYSALTEDPRCAPLLIAGIGIVLVGDGLVCVDLDEALTPGGLTADAALIVDKVPTFTEVSPGGRGLHLWVRGTLARAVTGAGFEAYDRVRYMTVTGQRWPGTPEDVESAPRLLAVLDTLTAPEAPRAAGRPADGPVRVRRRMPIPTGTRDNSLYRIACALVRDGHRGAALLEALAEANARLGQPPLPEQDVRRIARSASRRP